MRPISTAFGVEVQTTGIKRTASELDFTPSGKPTVVLSLVESRVAQFINNERSFTIRLDTEDGGLYVLQATNKREMMKWMESISKIATMAAKRRLTYLGNSLQMQVSDHIHQQVGPASRDPSAGLCSPFNSLTRNHLIGSSLVFGVDLEVLLRRETGGSEAPPGTVPRVLELCLSEIETRGLSEVGICSSCINLSRPMLIAFVQIESQEPHQKSVAFAMRSIGVSSRRAVSFYLP